MNTLTGKQASVLFRFTSRKFWEPGNPPPPTIAQASDIISSCFEWMREKEDGHKRRLALHVVAMVRNWFPDFQESELKARFGKRKKSVPATSENGWSGGGHWQESLPFNAPEHKAGPAPSHESAPDESDETAAEKEADSLPVPEKEPEQEQEKPAKKAARETAESGETENTIEKLINAGIRNIWLHGPAGCGKTTVCKLVADRLGVPCTILSCSAGTSPCEFIGWRFPSRPSAVTKALSVPGIIVLDEFTTLPADVASVANAILANGEVETSCGHVVRHDDCIIIATANTVGDGGNRQYVANSQLDAATLDRFAGAFVGVDYSEKYEAQFCGEVVAFVKVLRDVIKRNNLRRVASTRSIINGEKLKKAGLDWRAALVATWSDDEKRLAGVK